MALFLQIGRKRYEVPTLQAASTMFCNARDASGLGASNVPEAFVVDDHGKRVARISYNGRVWPPGEWKAGMVPIDLAIADEA